MDGLTSHRTPGIPFRSPNIALSSMPIEIPARLKPVMSPIPSTPIRRSMSPDMLFEMSPLTSESARYFLESQRPDDDRPLLYTFPVVSIHPKPRSSNPDLGNPAPGSTRQKHWPMRSLPSQPRSAAQKPFTSFELVTALQRPAKHGATHKIKGFVPLIQNKTPDESLSPSSASGGRLSPPPSSLYSSPWILPGTRDNDVAQSWEASSPSAFEFDKYLARRIERQNCHMRPRVHHISMRRNSLRG